jgi:hypothetical protein
MVVKSVDDYIDSLEPWQVELVSRVRQIVFDAAPEVKESFKWAQPVYEANGPFAYIKAFKNAVNFGFWRGIDLQGHNGRLVGTGNKMRHFNLTSLKDIDEKLFSDCVRHAVELNQVKGDPTKGK